ncbi:hypothetical protein IQ07DRAFT_644118 [Pyrenochaeta sp. DS3sAY3a]|nr:hypothetical protein IQ07DRAFT_644118 [Pyrenochaeta sp. DS3sAY3a]
MSSNTTSNSASTSGSSKGSMTKADSERIQSTQAKGGNDVGAGSFAAKAQSAGDRNAAAGAGTTKN